MEWNRARLLRRPAAPAKIGRKMQPNGNTGEKIGSAPKNAQAEDRGVTCAEVSAYH
jgi:hypothetical protein